MFNRKNKLTFALLIAMILSFLLLAFTKTSEKETSLSNADVKAKQETVVRETTERSGRFKRTVIIP